MSNVTLVAIEELMDNILDKKLDEKTLMLHGSESTDRNTAKQISFFILIVFAKKCDDINRNTFAAVYANIGYRV
jgi:hypothetical protein